MAATVAGSAVGPLPLALSAERLGGYEPVLVTFTLAAAALAVVAAMTSRPAREPGTGSRARG